MNIITSNNMERGKLPGPSIRRRAARTRWRNVLDMRTKRLI
jgi:hypothetical protein